jgi:hypothetical protein
VRVTAPDAFLDVLMEGGSAYHFFGRSAEKVVLMRRAATGKIASRWTRDVNFAFRPVRVGQTLARGHRHRTWGYTAKVRGSTHDG